MVCLFHGDYGPPDPGFLSGSTTGARGWTVDRSLLKEAHNIGEAEAIQRHALRGETITWCHPGYSWVDQPAIDWFYLAAFVFVVLPYFFMKRKVLRRRFDSKDKTSGPIEAPRRSPS